MECVNGLIFEGGLSRTPFVDDRCNPCVYVCGGAGPYINTKTVLANFDLSPVCGKRVLLKPNAGRAVQPNTGINTHPQVVAAAIDAFREAGAFVAIGESPITGVKTFEAFELCGIKEIAEERDCPLIDMDERQFVPLAIPDGIAIQKLKICREVMEYDIIVSIPVMKMHMHTGVTLSVKNMKGCLWRRSKVELHMLPKIPNYDEKPLDIAIADMASVLTPHFALIDGTIGMEGLGPSAGSTKALDVVVAAIDPFAADAVACALMGTTAENIPHLRMGATRGYGIINLDALRIFPDDWRQFVKVFDLPPENLSLEFPNVTIFDKQSCSACQASLMLFLRKYGDQLFKPESSERKMAIAIGKGEESLPSGTLCIGNCTAKRREDNPFVPGCPPVVSEIMNVYLEYFQ